MKKEDEFLTVEQVAELLKVHPDTVRARIKDKTIKAVKIGPRMLRIKRSWIDGLKEIDR